MLTVEVNIITKMETAILAIGSTIKRVVKVYSIILMEKNTGAALSMMR